MTCPTCGSPRPEERLLRFPKSAVGATWHPVGVLCNDDFHNQILDHEKREQVLPSQY